MSDFKQGQSVLNKVDKLKYTIDFISKTDGTPGERLLVIRLAGRYKWLWTLTSPAITSTLPESYAKEVLVII